MSGMAEEQTPPESQQTPPEPPAPPPYHPDLNLIDVMERGEHTTDEEVRAMLDRYRERRR